MIIVRTDDAMSAMIKEVSLQEMKNDESKLLEELYLALQIVLLTIVLNVAFPLLSDQSDNLLKSFGIVFALYLLFKLFIHFSHLTKENSEWQDKGLAYVDGFFFGGFIFLESVKGVDLFELFHVYIIMQAIRFPQYRLSPYALLAAILHFIIGYRVGVESWWVEWIISMVLYQTIAVIVSFALRQVGALREERQFYHCELQRKNDELKTLANTDFLTKLNNHQSFYTYFEQIRRQSYRNQMDVSIVILDIDNFKRVNDTYGHLAGDQVLGEVAAVLRKNTRHSDFIARYGGEEFVIVFPNTSLTAGLALAERIRGAVEAHAIPIEGVQLTVTISMGLVTRRFISVSDNGQECLARADELLYEAKTSGKNRIGYEKGQKGLVFSST